jgi:hypothetical protein
MSFSSFLQSATSLVKSGINATGTGSFAPFGKDGPSVQMPAVNPGGSILGNIGTVSTDVTPQTKTFVETILIAVGAFFVLIFLINTVKK